MGQRLLNRTPIQLNPLQQKLVERTWGAAVYSETVVEKMTYLSDGLKVNGYLAYPANAGAGKGYPCVIWNRGGAKDKGLIDEFHARGLYGQLASWGYVVFASHYRGNGGSEGTDQFGGEELNDIANLRLLAEEISFADPARWGMEGWSRGGMMTYLMLTRDHTFKAAIVLGGIADLPAVARKNESMKKVFQSFIGTGDFAGKLRERSVFYCPDRLSRTTPLLIVHGANDDRIPPQDSLEMSKLLLREKISHRLVLLEEADHFLKQQRKEVDRLRRQWFETYLQ